MTSPISLAERIRSLEPARALAGRNVTKADTLFYHCGDIDVAVKNYGPRPWIIRQTLGRLMIRREASAYRASRRLPGIPRFHGRLGPFALATEWVDGRPLSEMRGKPLPEGFFRGAFEILDALHGGGIALGDLHHRDLLILSGGSACIVDLATAMVLGDTPGRLRRALFDRLCDQDHIALLRMRARFRGIDETEAMAAVDARAVAWHRRGRLVKRLLDRLRGRKR
jgi:hypothetical protein